MVTTVTPPGPSASHPAPASAPHPSSRRRHHASPKAHGGDPAVLEDKVTDDGGDVYFETNSDQLNTNGLNAIALLAAKAHAAGIEHMTVVGHADTAGAAKYNDSLSLRRANAVAVELEKHGFKADAIETKAVGEHDLLVQTPDNTANAHNRAVEITLDKPAAPAATAAPPPAPQPEAAAPPPAQAPVSTGDQLQHTAKTDLTGGVHHVKHGLIHLVGSVFGLPLNILKHGAHAVSDLAKGKPGTLASLPFNVAGDALHSVAGVAGSGLEIGGGAVKAVNAAPTEASGLAYKASDATLNVAKKDGDPVAGTVGVATGMAGGVTDAGTTIVRGVSDVTLSAAGALENFGNGRKPNAGAASAMRASQAAAVTAAPGPSPAMAASSLPAAAPATSDTVTVTASVTTPQNASLQGTKPPAGIAAAAPAQRKIFNVIRPV